MRNEIIMHDNCHFALYKENIMHDNCIYSGGVSWLIVKSRIIMPENCLDLCKTNIMHDNCQKKTNPKYINGEIIMHDNFP